MPYAVFGQNAVRFQMFHHEADIATLKFYVSNVRVTFEDNSQLKLDEPAYLIDFEETNEASISVPSQKKISSIQFYLGTDSTLNVAGILSGDLDPILGMYWAWNTGYINFKLEGKDKIGQFEYHIGGYLAPYSTHREIFVSSDTVTIDVDAWLIEAVRISRQLMIPGKQASELADLFPLLFQREQ